MGEDVEEHPWWKAIGLPPALPQLAGYDSEKNMLNRCWIRRDVNWTAMCGKPVVDPEIGLCAEHIQELRELEG